MNICEWILLGVSIIIILGVGASLTVLGLLKLEKKGWW